MGFAEFVGNDRVVSVLRRMLARDRIPGTLLFEGQQGVGKFTLATLFVRAALCEARRDDFCGECATCRPLAALDDLSALIRQARDERGRSDPEEVPLLLQPHPDVTVLVPDPTYIRMGQMRAVRRLSHSAASRGRRFVILDQAERLRVEFAGTLLKVLEEPPAGAHFLLLTHAPFELPSTVRSRAVPLGFAPLPREAIEQYLAKHRPKMPKKDRVLSAAVAAGSLGTALGLDLERYHQVREAALSYLGVAAGQQGNPSELFRATAELSGRSRRGQEEEPGGARAEFEFSLGVLYSLLSDVLYLKARAAGLGLHNPDVQTELGHLMGRIEWGWIASKVSGLDRIERGLRRNLNRQLALDSLALADLPAEIEVTSEPVGASQ